MGLLRDEDLVTNRDQYFTDLPSLPTDPYIQESPIHPSSIDLHIGQIYLPGIDETPTGDTRTKMDHALKAGETAVVTTLETVQLPATVAAIGFPPSGDVSYKGLLMTNPGHVDPGYTGRLKFTVINMGKEPFSLKRGDRIVRLLLFTLDKAVKADWKARNPKEPRGKDPIQQEVNRLSKDFADVERRAEDIAKKQGIQWGAGITVAAGLILGIFQLISSGHLFGNKELADKIKDLEKNQQSIEQQMKIDKRLTDLEQRLKVVETQKQGRAGTQKLPKETKKGAAASQ